MFIPGGDSIPRGHLIWPVNCPMPIIKKLVSDQEYRGECRVADQGTTAYVGPALVKRRKQYGSDLLVVLLPDVDVGQLSSKAVIDLDPDSLK